MSESTLRRLRYTPLWDLLRGRVSGRLDVKGTINASDLPAPAKEVVLGVVKRTRLWLSERVDVANELIAHFQDGIESGRSVDDVIEKFGEERKAAKLIRRAKRRNRPLAWHVLRGFGWIIVVMLAIYAFLGIRFVLERPSPAVNYQALLNQPILAVPEDQRGWPIYRQAILGIGERNKKDAVDRLNEVVDAQPGSEHWAMVEPWLKDHQKVVELTRQAARKPIIGFILGKDGSMNDPEVYPNLEKLAPRKDEGVVMTILLPFRIDLRFLASIVNLDARFARQQHDPQRVMIDLEALLKIPQQMHRDSGFLVMDFMALGLRAFVLQAVEEAVLDENLKLSDADLQKLAHEIAGPRVAADLFDLALERMLFLDLVQRCYSDDGDGDGHLTREGQRFLRYTGIIPGTLSQGYEAVLIDSFSWGAAPLSTSRKQVVAKYQRLMDVADANFRRPMREANWHSYEKESYELDQVKRIREPLFRVIMPLDSVQQRAELWLGHRDGVVVGLALELYRRKQGEYPKSLDLLVPQYLPQIPADRITGGPVKYKLVKGKPLIYSVGADRDDDGGKPPRGKNGWIAAAQTIHAEKAVDGDWVLYPQSKDEIDH